MAVPWPSASSSRSPEVLGGGCWDGGVKPSPCWCPGSVAARCCSALGPRAVSDSRYTSMAGVRNPSGERRPSGACLHAALPAGNASGWESCSARWLLPGGGVFSGGLWKPPPCRVTQKMDPAAGVGRTDGWVDGQLGGQGRRATGTGACGDKHRGRRRTPKSSWAQGLARSGGDTVPLSPPSARTGSAWVSASP